MTVWHSLSGGGHPPPETAGRTPSRKQQQWASVRNHLDALLDRHQQPVTHATPPVVPAPEEVDRRQVRRELRAQQRAGIPWCRLGERRAAHRRADQALPRVLEQRQAERRAAHATGQQEADAWWQRLVANDPDTVIARLEDAFAAQQLPATPTAVEGTSAHIAVSVLPVEQLIGPREPAGTEVGDVSLARMTRTRRHELYQAAISSAVIAIAAEAFATCPGITTLDVAVVCPEQLGGPAVLLLAELPREAVLPGDARQPIASSLTELAAGERAKLVVDRGSRIGAWRPLDPEHDGVRDLLDILDAE